MFSFRKWLEPKYKIGDWVSYPEKGEFFSVYVIDSISSFLGFHAYRIKILTRNYLSGEGYPYDSDIDFGIYGSNYSDNIHHVFQHRIQPTDFEFLLCNLRRKIVCTFGYHREKKSWSQLENGILKAFYPTIVEKYRNLSDKESFQKEIRRVWRRDPNAIQKQYRKLTRNK